MRSAGLACTSGRCGLMHTLAYRPLLPAARRTSHVPDRAMPSLSVCNAASQGSGRQVFKGIYGDWTLEQSDVDEVKGYRVGLTIAAAGETSARGAGKLLCCLLTG